MVFMKKSVRMRILELLKEHREGLRQADIVRALGVSRSYVSEVIRGLVKAGVVKRVIESGIVKYVLVRESVFEEKCPKILKLGIVWSSEYPFITYLCKYLRRESNILLETIVYSNALDATWDLVLNKVDLVLSPMVTQFLYASLTRNIVIIGGGASGGAGFYMNRDCKLEIGVSSKISTMDLLLSYGLKEIGVSGYRKVYGLSGEEIFMAIASGRARYAALWEPLASRLERMGFKKLYTLDDLGLPHCCTLAVSNRVSRDYRELVSRLYRLAIEEFTRKPEPALEWYSLKTGIPLTLLRDSIREYTYKDYIDLAQSIRALHKASLHIPSPYTLGDYIEF